MMRAFAVVGLVVAVLLGSSARAQLVRSEAHAFNVTVLTEGLQFPWGLALLPDGRALITERPGRLRIVSKDGLLDPTPIAAVPSVDAAEQGGLLDVAIHPRFATNQFVYLAYTPRSDAGRTLQVARARLQDMQLQDLRVIFTIEPRSSRATHYGARLVFDEREFLYVTLGDRGEAARAQEIADLAGKVVRLHDDGRIPADNPPLSQAGARGEIYTLGHRNVQGAVFDPIAKRLWIHEHGEDANDRLIALRAGVNYGWPGQPGAAAAAHRWTPTIAPSGMALYVGDRFPDWRGNLFLGSLKDRMLVRLVLDGEKVVREERLLQGVLGRIRDVRAGLDGHLYLLIDDRNGKLVRLDPR